MTILDRYALDAYANQLSDQNGKPLTLKEARVVAQTLGLIVHQNRAGNWFVSHPAYELRHPLNPTD
jgi:hypothetical protein